MRPVSEERGVAPPDQLIIVDPSLRDYVGHHAQYDRSVLQAARHSAVPAIVLAHREAKQFVKIDDAMDPVFSRDVWGHRRAAARGGDLARVGLYRLVQAVTVVPLALSLWTSTVRHLLQAPASTVVGRLARALANALRRSRALVRTIEVRDERLDSTPAPGEVLASPADKPELWRRSLEWILSPMLAVGRYGAIRIRRVKFPFALFALFMLNPRYFFEAIGAIKRHYLGKRALVFFHMIVADNLLESVLLAIWCGRNLKIPAVLLFRYPPPLCRRYRVQSMLAFRVLERAFEAGVVRVLTDSQRLPIDFSEFSYVPMEVVPIPHGVHLACGAPKDRKRLRIASLGNARAEKGILEIIDAVEILRARPVFAELEFVLQVNDPSEDCREGIDRWARSGPGPNVELIASTLDADSYAALFESVDVVLAPYWREVYASRTSGTLLDALTSAKPVIVTKDTWMSDEVGRWGSGLTISDRDPRALADAIERLVRDFQVHSTLAMERAILSREFHSAASFLEHLIGRRRSRFLRDREVLVSYPWGNLFLRNSGASVRSSLLIAALIRSGHAVAAHCTSDEEIRAAGSQVRCIKYPGSLSTIRAPLFFLATLIRVLGGPWQYEARHLWFRFEYWCRERPFRLLLNRELYGCTAVFLEYPFLADVAEPLCRGHGIALVVTAHDVLSKQIGNSLARRQLMRKEVAAMRCATLSVCVSDADVEAFARYGCASKLIPNPIDADSTQGLPELEALAILERNRLVLPDRFCLFVGSDHPPNREAARHIAGFARDPPSALLDMSFVTMGRCRVEASESPRFIQLGQVSSEILAAAYSLAQFVLVPLTQGTGTSLKVIEAMAYGKVVIGTASAFRGIPVTDGEDAVGVDRPDQMLDRIVALLREPDRLRAIGESARRFAQGFDYRTVFLPYLSLLRNTPWEGLSCSAKQFKLPAATGLD